VARKSSYIRNETPLPEAKPTDGTGFEQMSLGATVAGRDLSTTRSSRRKGRKSVVGHKKLEAEAD
jgi:hypothetical protein